MPQRVLAAAATGAAPPMTPRVLLLTTYYHPVVGGVETHAPQYDVSVCVGDRGAGIAAIAAGALKGHPVIAQGETAGVLAGADSYSNSGLPPEALLTRALKAPIRAIYRRADQIVCIGHDL